MPRVSFDFGLLPWSYTISYFEQKCAKISKNCFLIIIIIIIVIYSDDQDPITVIYMFYIKRTLVVPIKLIHFLLFLNFPWTFKNDYKWQSIPMLHLKLYLIFFISLSQYKVCMPNLLLLHGSKKNDLKRKSRYLYHFIIKL